MIKNYINDKTVEINVDVKSWQEAIKVGGKLLEEEGAIEHSYTTAMIDTVKNMGPYIVIAPGIAMPHARPEMGVNNIRIGILKLKTPVNFGNEENDPVDIVVFLCAVDSTSHIKVLEELVGLIEDEKFLEVVRNASSKKEILDYITKK